MNKCYFKYLHNTEILFTSSVLVGTISCTLPSSKEIDQKTVDVLGVEIKMQHVAAGEFQMGGTDMTEFPDSFELPVRKVSLKDYYIGQTEVTQELWLKVMGTNPSEFVDLTHPVENVSWVDCMNFIRKLNELTGLQFRLPTEAEWEYAARGGNRSNGTSYSGSRFVEDVAWFEQQTTLDVASKFPNELGLYDMSGNVWEWCSDWFGNYPSEPDDNPVGASSGECRVIRGGSWSSNSWNCRVSARSAIEPIFNLNNLGFRLVISEK